MIVHNKFKTFFYLLLDSIHLINSPKKDKDEKPTKWEIFLDQIIDSVIIGGIAGLSAYVAAGSDASIKTAVVTFLLTFFIKMKEYRKIK